MPTSVIYKALFSHSCHEHLSQQRFELTTNDELHFGQVVVLI